MENRAGGVLVFKNEKLFQFEPQNKTFYQTFLKMKYEIKAEYWKQK